MKVNRSSFELTSNKDFKNIGLISDVHFGSSSLLKKALKSDLNRMAEAEAEIAINGDLWDFILPSDIKRFDLDALDRELLKQGVKPLDAALDMAYEYLKPYAPLIKFIGIGNHEAHVKKRHHICLTSILIDRLNQLPNVNVEPGGWCGYWHITLNLFSAHLPFVLYRHHGAGGGAPVTKGIMDFQRLMAWQGNVDALWLGHNHYKKVYPDVKMILDIKNNKVYQKNVWCIRTASYLDTYGLETAPSYAEGWNVSPQPVGGVILKLKAQETIVNKKRIRQVACEPLQW
jgi:hypothetical protein